MKYGLKHGFLLLFCVGIISCHKPLPSETTLSSTKRPSETEAKAIIQNKAHEVLIAVKNQDFSKLASHVHPRKGVLFSPVATIGEGPNLVFSQLAISALEHNDSIKYIWGKTDNDELIQFTVKEYLEQYVFNVDFSLDKNPTYNQHNQPGTAINNVFEIYPEAIVVDYYDKGPVETDGMGWRYLRLVFEVEKEKWFLVGVVNDQWSI